MERTSNQINLVGRPETMIRTGKGGISRRKQERSSRGGIAIWVVYHAPKFDSPSVPVQYGNRFQSTLTLASGMSAPRTHTHDDDGRGSHTPAFYTFPLSSGRFHAQVSLPLDRSEEEGYQAWYKNEKARYTRGRDGWLVGWILAPRDDVRIPFVVCVTGFRAQFQLASGTSARKTTI